MPTLAISSFYILCLVILTTTYCVDSRLPDLTSGGPFAFLGSFQGVSLNSEASPSTSSSGAGARDIPQRVLSVELSPVDAIHAVAQSRGASADSVSSLVTFRDDAGVLTSICSHLVNNETQLYIGGGFSGIGDQDTSNVFRVTLPSKQDREEMPDVRIESLGSGLSGPVFDLECGQDGRVVMAGAFGGGEPSEGVAVWEDESWRSFAGGGVDGYAWAVTKYVESDPVMWFGGSVSSQVRSRLSTKAFPVHPRLLTYTPRSESIKTLTSAGTLCDDLIAQRFVTIEADGGRRPSFENPATFSIQSPFFLHLTRIRILNRGVRTFSIRSSGVPLRLLSARSQIAPICASACELSDHGSVWQEFYVVPGQISANTWVFSVDIFEVHSREDRARSVGFADMEISQNQVFGHAVDDLNEPPCGKPWSRVVQAVVSDPDSKRLEVASDPKFPNGHRFLLTSAPGSFEVRFDLPLLESGEYEVLLAVPPCRLDDATPRNCEQPRATIMSTINIDVDSRIGAFSQAFVDFNRQQGDLVKLWEGVLPDQTRGFELVLSVVAVSVAEVSKVVDTVVVRPKGSSLDEGNDPSADVVQLSRLDLEDDGALWGFARLNTDRVSTVMAVDRLDRSLIAVATAVGTNLTSSRTFIVDSEGTILHTSPAVKGEVVTLCHDANGIIYLGGNFDHTIGDTRYRNILAWNYTADIISPFFGGVDGAVTTMTITNQTIRATGSFSRLFESPESLRSRFVPKIFTYNFASGELKAPAAYLGGTVKGATVSSDTLYAVGHIPAYETISADCIAQVIESQDGGTRTQQSGADRTLVSFPPLPLASATVRAGVFMENDVLVVAGDFVQGEYQNAAILRGGRWRPLSHLSNLGQVNAMFGSEQTVFFGGSFSGGRSGFAQYNLEEDQVVETGVAFSGGVEEASEILALAHWRNVIAVGGRFGGVEDVKCRNVCLFAPQGRVWSAFEGEISGADGAVHGMVVLGNVLYLVGDFLSIGDLKEVNHAAAFDYETRTWSPVIDLKTTLPGPLRHVKTTAEGSLVFGGIRSKDQNPFLAFHNPPNPFTIIYDMPPGVMTDLVLAPCGSSCSPFFGLNPNPPGVVAIPLGRFDMGSDGHASALVFDGQAFRSLATSSLSDGAPGTIFGVVGQLGGTVIERPTPVWLVILISVGIASAITLIIFAGMAAFHAMRRRVFAVAQPTQPGSVSTATTSSLWPFSKKNARASRTYGRLSLSPEASPLEMGSDRLHTKGGQADSSLSPSAFGGVAAGHARSGAPSGKYAEPEAGRSGEDAIGAGVEAGPGLSSTPAALGHAPHQQPMVQTGPTALELLRLEFKAQQSLEKRSTISRNASQTNVSSCTSRRASDISSPSLNPPPPLPAHLPLTMAADGAGSKGAGQYSQSWEPTFNSLTTSSPNTLYQPITTSESSSSNPVDSYPTLHQQHYLHRHHHHHQQQHPQQQSRSRRESPPQQPQQEPFQCHVLIPYTAQEPGELDLYLDDTIWILDSSDSAWWLGMVERQGMPVIQGIFPSKHVRPVP